ncbi:hypothetical protein GCM10010106_14820 [Thermopolyspora flexuosa]|jgi:hypothetical protein|uniref:Uncharacterized protein n=1 Tax=Thermopolyspora flexuosa TaxID=103836 RepID=A0A543IPP5_9ACTN|nr:hypothetical protein [Thermopolyspora flexuosa]TQM72552.1 hypothetical protein FHX40_4699 [Thermopolyspora flexuosa]GGM69637.1 hypothetical protein GCM10010106_14820 [Thermopolyspora flexuosa]
MPAEHPAERLAESADIVFTATVRAEAMRFDRVPETNVTFSEEPGERSISESRRENLPERVAEGVTYREVRVRYVLAAGLSTSARTPPRASEGPPGSPVAMGERPASRDRA